MKTRHVLTVLLISSFVPAVAGAGNWVVRVRGARVDNDLGYRAEIDAGESIRTAVDPGFGLELTIEYRATNRLGIELGALVAEPDTAVTVDVSHAPVVRVSQGLGFVAATASVTVHLTPDRPVDAYLGAGLARVNYSGIGYDVGSFSQHLRFEGASDVTWGVVAGADFALGDSRWAASLGLRYIAAELGLDLSGAFDDPDFDFDPLAISAGLGFRF